MAATEIGNYSFLEVFWYLIHLTMPKNAETCSTQCIK